MDTQKDERGNLLTAIEDQKADRQEQLAEEIAANLYEQNTEQQQPQQDADMMHLKIEWRGTVFFLDVLADAPQMAWIVKAVAVNQLEKRTVNINDENGEKIAQIYQPKPARPPMIVLPGR